MVKFLVKRLEMADLKKGFLETLDNLIPVGDLSLERAKNIYKEISQNPVYNIFVAMNDRDEIIGTTTLLIEQKFLAKGACMAHIEDVSTRKGFEGQGIGSALVKTAVEEARSRGCFRIDLSCSDDNVVFYESNGFKKDENAMKIWYIPLKELIRRSKER